MTAARRLSRIHSIDDFRAAARRALPRMVFDYIDGGAGTESTLRENRAALERVRLVPTAPVDVSRRSQEIELFGRRWSMPVIVAPLGLASAFWPKGELALARAAGRHGIPFVLSNNASVTLEEAATAGDGRKWFQLYVPPSREGTRRWVDSVREAGFDALQITVDTAVPGLRLRDRRRGFSMPFRWTPRRFLDVALHPPYAMRMGRQGIPRPHLMYAIPWAEQEAADPTAMMRNRLTPALDWDLLRWLRDQWKGPLIVKGITDPRQAKNALAAGMDAIVISNHGGRQMDGAVSTIDVLPDFATEIGGRMPILIDSGFRTGTDILKALALGATAVQVGRAAAYALAAAGEDGVHHALALLRAEIDIGMALCGVTTIGALNRDFIRRAIL